MSIRDKLILCFIIAGGMVVSVGCIYLVNIISFGV
jgi:hypothetical protein